MVQKSVFSSQGKRISLYLIGFLTYNHTQAGLKGRVLQLHPDLFLVLLLTTYVLH